MPLYASSCTTTSIDTWRKPLVAGYTFPAGQEWFVVVDRDTVHTETARAEANPILSQS